MAGQDRDYAEKDGRTSAYDPSEYARGLVTSHSGNLGGGIGQRSEKNPTATLRIIGSNLGHQWLSYGHVGGGTQDYRLGEAVEGKLGKVLCDWFLFYYQGIMVIDEAAVFGDWKVTVHGSGLELVCYEVARNIRSMLRAGETENSDQKITVDSIEIEPYQPVAQDGSRKDRDDD